MDDEWDESAPVAVQPTAQPVFTSTTYTRGGGGRGRNFGGSDNRNTGGNWRTGERDQRNNQNRGQSSRGRGPGGSSGGGGVGGDNDGRRCKRTINVPSSKVGRIIGKGGSKIRDLEYESSANIKIGDSSGVETTVNLFAADEDALGRAQDLIEVLMEDFKPRNNDYNNDNQNRGGGYGGDNDARRCKRTINVPSSKVGRIIGKGGSKIRDLEQESTASIKIGDSSDVETTVSLFANDEDSLNRAQDLIDALMEDFKPRQPRSDMD